MSFSKKYVIYERSTLRPLLIAIIPICITLWIVVCHFYYLDEKELQIVLVSAAAVVAGLLYLFLTRNYPRNVYLVIDNNGVGFVQRELFYEFDWDEIDNFYEKKVEITKGRKTKTKKSYFVKPKGLEDMELEIRSHIHSSRRLKKAVIYFSKGKVRYITATKPG